MSVETGSGLERGTQLGSVPLTGSEGFQGLNAWRGGLASGIAEVRGPAACKRRDAIFRRMLLLADVVAMVAAVVLTVTLARRSVQLTWAGVAALPILSKKAASGPAPDS